MTMSKKQSGDDLKARVESLIDAASVVTTGHVSLVNRDILTDAVTHDLDLAAHQALDDRERLDKLETQTQALADAVIAIADTGPSAAVAPAVETVKAEMSVQGPPLPITDVVP
jgi:hypothetical protein